MWFTYWDLYIFFYFTAINLSPTTHVLLADTINLPVPFWNNVFVVHRGWWNDTIMINNSARNKRASKYNKRQLDRRNFERTRGPLQVLANYNHVTEYGTSRHDVLIHLSKFLAATVADPNLTSTISSVCVIFTRLNNYECRNIGLF